MTAEHTVPDGLTETVERLALLIRKSPADLYLVRLSDLRILEASDSVLARAQRSREELLTQSLLTEVQDPVSAKRSFALLAEGLIDSFVRHGAFLMPDGSYQQFTARYTTCPGRSERVAAVGVLLPADREAQDPADAVAEEAPAPNDRFIALGTVDAEWRVDRITNEVQELLGRSPEEVLCRSVFTLIHPEDVGSLLLLAAHAATQPGGSLGRVRVMGADGTWTWCRLSVHAVASDPPAAFAFSLSGDTQVIPAQDPRTLELEEHLRRIAREVASSGVAALSTDMPTSIELPQLSELTAREYEIVVRLTHGQRIAAIARSLFLSESTVRNHLTGVYRKLGVSSQTELIDLLDGARTRQGRAHHAR